VNSNGHAAIGGDDAHGSAAGHRVQRGSALRRRPL